MLTLQVLGSSSKGNCYILSNNDTSIMLDCGVDPGRILNNIDINKINGIIITHCHQDHCKGIKKLKDYINCKVYSNDETLEILPILETQKQEVKCGEKFDIGSFSLITFHVEHDVKNFGYLIKDNISHHKLVYLTDCGMIPNIQFKDIDTFLIEANYDEKWYKDKEDLDVKELRNLSGKGHLSIQETTEFLKDNVNYNTKFIILGHISRGIEEYSVMCEPILEMLKEKDMLPPFVAALDPNIEEIIEIRLKEEIKLW